MGSYDRFGGPTLEQVKERAIREKSHEGQMWARMLVSETYKTLNKIATAANLHDVFVTIPCKDEDEYKDVLWALSWDDDETDPDDPPHTIFAFYGVPEQKLVVIAKTWQAIVKFTEKAK